MSTDLETVSAPSYLAALMAVNPALAAINQEALSGSAKPMPPTIVADKGKFLTKIAGEETVIVFPDTPQNQAAGIVGMPMSRLQGVILKPKPGKEKAWYATKYTPGQENQSPDCFSDDGVKPDPSSRLKQCDNCASCPQNVFGSGTDAQGNPGKGKACADRKVVAIYANGGAFRFAVPPASLKNWDTYCNQLTAKGIPLPAVITVIGFESGDTDYKLTFSFNGMLAEQQLVKVVAMLDTPEVKEIVLPRNAAPQLPAPLAAAEPAESNVVDMAAEKAKKDEADKQAKAAAAKAKKEAAEKAKKEADAKAAAAATSGDLDLGLGGLNEAAPQTVAATAETAGGVSDDDLIDSLGL